MNMGQLVLVVGALTLLATLSLGIKSSLISASLSTYDNDATIDAISIGEAMINEIRTQAFDSVTYTQYVSDPSIFTPSGRLGPDLDTEKTVNAGGVLDTLPFLSQTVFNDVDDYDKYKRLVKSPYLGNFVVTDSIYYVLESDLTTRSNTQTWFKKIVVKITHPNLLNPVILRSLAVYRRYLGST